MLPFWTSFLIRIYAWMFLLRDTGLINSALQAMHLIREPLPLLFNTGAVILGLVYGYLPFMVLPLYATLEKLDPVAARSGRRSGRFARRRGLAGRRAASEARNAGRLSLGFRSVLRRLSDA